MSKSSKHVSEYDRKNASKKRDLERYQEGRYYVDITDELTNSIIVVCSNAPVKYDKYILTPLFECTDRIDELVNLANGVYMVHKNTEDSIKAYEERIEYLTEAVRMFKVFDRRWNRFTDNIDYVKSEYQRMLNIFVDIAVKNGFVVINDNAWKRENGMDMAYSADIMESCSVGDGEAAFDERVQKNSDDNSVDCSAVFDKSSDGKYSRQRTYVDGRVDSESVSDSEDGVNNVPSMNVRIYRENDYYVYESVNGKRKMLLGVTRKQVAHIDKLRYECRKAVSNRLSKDLSEVNVLKRKNNCE